MTDKPVGANLLKLCDANKLEYILRSLVPVIHLDERKFLFGTQAKNYKLLSDKIMVAVGGGHILVENHWRTVAVTEIIKLNKLLQKKPKDAKKKVTITN